MGCVCINERTDTDIDDIKMQEISKLSNLIKQKI